MLHEKLDSTDIEILKLLQVDNKQTIKDIAQKLNLSSTPIFERIKKLDKLGIIHKNIAVLNPKLLGLKLTAFISISVSDHRKEAIERFSKEITPFPEVMECHHVTGNSDFQMEGNSLSARNSINLLHLSQVYNLINRDYLLIDFEILTLR